MSDDINDQEIMMEAQVQTHCPELEAPDSNLVGNYFNQPLELGEAVPEQHRTKIVMINNKTGRAYTDAALARFEARELTPKHEQAIALFATGKFSRAEAAAQAGLNVPAFSNALNSAAGQAVVSRVRGEIEFKFQSLFNKVTDVIHKGLDHPDPAVSLASAKLWLSNARREDVNEKLTAEDVIRHLMSGGGAQ